MALDLSIYTDSGSYGFGDTVKTFISCKNPDKAITGDLYIILLNPEGKLFFMPDQTIQYFKIPNWSENATHAIPDLTIPAGFKLDSFELLSFIAPGQDGFPPIAVPGKYTFGIALTKPNTLDILQLGTYLFEYNKNINSTQSDCLGSPLLMNKEENSGFDGKIAVTVDGNDVTITHNDVVYNCAAVVEFESYCPAQNQIALIEHETLPNGAANCICKFNLETKIEDLKPGTYTLKVYRDSTTYLFGEFEFTISGNFYYKSTNCKGNALTESYDKTLNDSINGDVKLAVDGSTLTMNHTDVEYNCAAVIQLTAKVEGWNITFDELETYPNGGPVYCMCLFDVEGTLMNLEPGLYTVKVTNDSQGKTFIEKQIKIEGDNYSFKQSDCKGSPLNYSKNQSEDGKVVISEKDGKILIQHFDTVYNCAAVIVADVEQSDNKIVVREIETLPNGSVRCICKFDFETTIEVADKGKYSVELWNADSNKMFGSAEVTIE
jgi:hypothetical protein